MTKEPYQLNHFKKWLISINGHSPISADTSIGILKRIYNEYPNDLPDSLALQKLVDDMDEWSIQLEFLNVFEMIYKRILSASFIERIPLFKRKKTLAQYCNFLLTLISPAHNKNPDEVIPKIIYHTELIELFTKKLATADGIYGNIYFPISVIKRLLYCDYANKRFFDNMMGNMVNNIALNTSKGSIALKDVKALQICTQGFVSIAYSDNTTRELYTNSKNGKTPTKLRVNRIENLEIRFVKPMREILKTTNGLADMLTVITSEILQYKNGAVTSKAELVQIAHELVNNGILNQSHNHQLRSALWLFADAAELEIMPAYEFGSRTPW